jgi:opacity protein-like surface antigen
MKRLLTRGVAFILLAAGVSAQGADVASPGKASSPAVAAVTNWTGLYLGPHIGAGFGYRYWTFPDGAVVESSDAVVGGGQVGANYQIGRWVLGVEADASFGNLNGATSTNRATFLHTCPDGVSNCRTRQHWIATATGRVGYAVDPALFYLKGGAAFTDSNYLKDTPAGSEAASVARGGWTVGAGMEFALLRNWSLKLEYDYLDFDKRWVALSGGGAVAENVAVLQRAHEVKLGFNYLFNGTDWAPSVAPDAGASAKPKAASEPEPQRRGLPAPLDSPPFPSGEWPLGGSQVIGVPDTSVGPLMQAIYDGPNGQAWKDSRIKLYGWVELSANASTSSHSNAPGGYPIRPNRPEFEQLVFRIERLPDTVQKDHVDWGFNVSSIYGLDYRYTIMKGIFSDQLLRKNHIYGFDLPIFYGELYFPQVADGLNIRIGRYLSIPDIESQLAPANYMFTHSLLYIYDPFTQMGVLGTVKLNDQWMVQLGVHAGNDVAVWEKGDAKLTGVACIRWVSKDGNDSFYPCVNSINDGKYAYDNIQMFVLTWSHKFSDRWNMQTEAYYTYQRDVPSVSGPLPIEPNTNGAVCPAGQIACLAPAWAVVNYLNLKLSKTDTIVFRNEYFDDARGQRTGTKSRYTTHGIGWSHWFNVWGENTALFRPELRYERAYDAPASDRQTKKEQFMLAADVILLF